MVTPVEIALGKAVLDTAGRSVGFFFRRSAHRDAGGGRKLEWLREQMDLADTAALMVARAVGRTQANAMLKYFDSAEFESALRHVLATRILYGPDFRDQASKVIALVGAGIRMYAPTPSRALKDAQAELVVLVIDLVDSLVKKQAGRLLKFAADPAFRSLLEHQVSEIELVIDSVVHTGDPRLVIRWLEQYQSAAVQRYSRVRTPHWNDSVLQPIDQIYVPARFKFGANVSLDDERVVAARQDWYTSTSRRLRAEYQSEAAHANALAAARAKRDEREVSYRMLPADRLVILGDPGAGKTTLGMRIARDLLSQKPVGSEDIQGLVPLVITLRDLPRMAGASFVEHLSTLCAESFQARPPDGLIELLLTTGRAFVIFDGLDELPDVSRRADVVSSIEAFATAYPNTRILVTSRLIGYEHAQLDPGLFTTLRILPFDDHEVLEYARTFFKLDGSIDLSSRPGVARAFFETTGTISDLRSNPLLLALLCNLYRATGYQELPRSRPAVLEKCALVLFDRWDRHRGIGKVRFEEEFAPTIAHLAYVMFTDVRFSDGISERDLLAVALQFLHPSRFANEDQARTFCWSLIEHCRDRAWVFSNVVSAGSIEDPQYHFTHRTFLEYFTASHIVRRHMVTERIMPLLEGPIKTLAWGLVPLLVFQILARNFDDEADRAVFHLLSSPTDNASRGRVVRFLVDVIRNIPLQPATVTAIVEKAAEFATDPGADRGPIAAFNSALNDVEKVAPENRAAFAQACLQAGWS